MEEEEEEGDERGQSPQELVLLSTDMAPAPGRSGIAILTAMRGTSPHPGPRKGPHRVYFMKGCSASPPASHTPPNCCRLPPPPLLPGPAPRGRASPGRGWQVGCWVPCPHGKPWRRGWRGGEGERDAATETAVILRIPKCRYPKGARWGLAPCPRLGFPSPEPTGDLGTDETLLCGPGKASGSRFLTVRQSGSW